MLNDIGIYTQPGVANLKKPNFIISEISPARCEVRWFFNRNYDEKREKEIRIRHIGKVG